MGKQPGVMLYFDVRPALAYLTDAEKGQLLDAILAYGELSTVPSFKGTLGAVWALIQPRIDYDRRKYQDKVVNAKKAVAAREAKRHPAQHLISGNIDTYPSTPTSITTNTSPPPTTPADYCRMRKDSDALLAFI